MLTVLNRNYPVKARPEILLCLANQPHLAPHYLNFLTDICSIDDDQSRVGLDAAPQWRCHQVWVEYRSLIKTSGRVYLRANAQVPIISLYHDGALAQFKAQFTVSDGNVDLMCNYESKIPIVTWLIGRGLDRILRQAVSAMDAYALAHWQEIQAYAGSKPQI